MTLADQTMSYKHNKDEQSDFFTPKRKMQFATALGLVGMTVACFYRYKVSSANEYIIKTGLGINGITVHKSTFLFPFQKWNIISMCPTSYKFTVHCMTKERVEASLPMTLNIGPIDPHDVFKSKTDPDKAAQMTSSDKQSPFVSYVKLIEPMDSKEREDTILGIVMGEVRVLAGNMTVESIADDRDKFRTLVSNNVQEDLAQFGLRIFNLNIEEFVDLPGNEYFKYRKQKALEQAQADAKIAVEEARKQGIIGAKKQEVEAKQEVAKLEADTALIVNENERRITESKMILQVAQAEYKRKTEMAELQATMNVAANEIDFKKELEQKNLAQFTEQIRAREMSKATVEAEARVKTAEGKAEALKKEADAHLYNEQKHAEAQFAVADADARGKLALAKSNADGAKAMAIAVAEGKSADSKGLLDLQLAEAKGIEAKGLANARSVEADLEAKAKGLGQIFDGRAPEPLIQLLALEGKVFEKVAEHTARTFQNMKPNVNIWNTGADAGMSNIVTDVCKGIVPMWDLIKKQTGLDVPKMPEQQPKN
jgi:flotillin